jgi:hypothetical protein
MEGSDGCVELNMQHQVPRLASGLVHPCVLVADLDCLPALDVAHAPSRFEHNPGVGLRRVGQAAPRYLRAADEYEHVAVFIPVNLASRPSLVTANSPDKSSY